MNLDRWRVFLQVAELGSLSRAASIVDRPHSVLSRQIAALEDDAGGLLFHRTGRGMVLSALGEEVLARIRDMVQQADEVGQIFRARAGGSIGHVRIGLLPSLAEAMVEPLVRDVTRQFPSVTFSIGAWANAALTEAVGSGALDLALLFRDRRRLGPADERLTDLNGYLIGRPGDPLTRQPTVALRELAGVRLIVPPPPNQMRMQMDQRAAALGIPIDVVIEVDSMAIQKQLVMSGFGYGLLTPPAIQAEVRAGLLSAARIVDPELSSVLALCRTTIHPATPLLREVARLLKRLANELIVPIQDPGANRPGASA